MGTATVINSPGLFGRQETIKQKTKEIIELNQTSAANKLANLSEDDFFTYGQLVELVSIAQTNQKITDISLIKKILNFVETIAEKLEPGSADLLFEHFNLNSDQLVGLFKQYPKFLQKLSQAKLQEYAESSPEVARNILSNTELSGILDRNKYARFQVYQKHQDNLWLADRAVGLSDIRRVYDHDQSASDKRALPENWQQLDGLYRQRDQLYKDKRNLEIRDEKLRQYLHAVKMKAKYAGREEQDSLLTSWNEVVEKLKIQLNLTSEDSRTVKQEITKNEKAIKNKSAEISKLLVQLRELCEQTQLGKRALDIFLRKQSTKQEIDQSHQNLFDLIEMDSKYISIIDERHIEAMFALVKNDKEFLDVFRYLAEDEDAIKELAKVLEKAALDPDKKEEGDSISARALNNLRGYIYKDKRLAIEENERGEQFLSDHPELARVLFKNHPKKFAENLALNKNRIAWNDVIKTLLEKSHDWLTSDHLVELNSKITDRKAWRKYLEGKNKPIEKLRKWATQAMKDKDPDKRVVEFLRNNPDVRGWMAVGKNKDLMSQWVLNSGKDHEVCRLVALDDYLYKNYAATKVADNTNQADGRIYLRARAEFEREVPIGIFTRVKSAVLDHIDSEAFTQETAFIIAEKYFDKIKPEQGWFEGDDEFQTRVNNFKAKSPFFAAKYDKKSLAQLALEKDLGRFLNVSNPNELLVAEIIRSAKDLDQLQQLAQKYDVIKRKVTARLKDEALKSEKINDNQVEFVLSNLERMKVDELVNLAPKNQKLRPEVNKVLKQTLISPNVLSINSDSQAYISSNVLPECTTPELVQTASNHTVLAGAADKILEGRVLTSTVADLEQITKRPSLKAQSDKQFLEKATGENISDPSYLKTILPEATIDQLLAIAKTNLTIGDDVDKQLESKLKTASVGQLVTVSIERTNLTGAANQLLLGKAAEITEDNHVQYVSGILSTASIEQLLQFAPNKGYEQKAEEVLKTKLDSASVAQLVAVATIRQNLKTEADKVLLIKVAEGAAPAQEQLAYVQDILAGASLDQLVAITKIESLKATADKQLIEYMTKTEVTGQVDYLGSLLPQASIEQLVSIFGKQPKLKEKAMTTIVGKLNEAGEDAWAKIAKEKDLFKQMPNYLSKAVELLRLADGEKAKSVFAANPELGVEVLDRNDLAENDVVRLVEVNNTAINQKIGKDDGRVLKLLNLDFSKYVEVFKSTVVKIIVDQKMSLQLEVKALKAILNNTKYQGFLLDEFKTNGALFDKFVSSPEVTGEELLSLWKDNADKLKPKLMQDAELLIKFLNAKGNDGKIFEDEEFDTVLIKIFKDKGLAAKLDQNVLSLIQKSENDIVKGALTKAAKSQIIVLPEKTSPSSSRQSSQNTSLSNSLNTSPRSKSPELKRDDESVREVAKTLLDSVSSNNSNPDENSRSNLLAQLCKKPELNLTKTNDSNGPKIDLNSMSKNATDRVQQTQQSNISSQPMAPEPTVVIDATGNKEVAQRIGVALWVINNLQKGLNSPDQWIDVRTKIETSSDLESIKKYFKMGDEEVKRAFVELAKPKKKVEQSSATSTSVSSSKQSPVMSMSVADVANFEFKNKKSANNEISGLKDYFINKLNKDNTKASNVVFHIMDNVVKNKKLFENFDKFGVFLDSELKKKTDVGLSDEGLRQAIYQAHQKHHGKDLQSEQDDNAPPPPPRPNTPPNNSIQQQTTTQSNDVLPQPIKVTPPAAEKPVLPPRDNQQLSNKQSSEIPSLSLPSDTKSNEVKATKQQENQNDAPPPLPREDQPSDKNGSLAKLAVLNQVPPPPPPPSDNNNSNNNLIPKPVQKSGGAGDRSGLFAAINKLQQGNPLKNDMNEMIKPTIEKIVKALESSEKKGEVTMLLKVIFNTPIDKKIDKDLNKIKDYLSEEEKEKFDREIKIDILSTQKKVQKQLQQAKNKAKNVDEIKLVVGNQTENNTEEPQTTQNNQSESVAEILKRRIAIIGNDQEDEEDDNNFDWTP